VGHGRRPDLTLLEPLGDQLQSGHQADCGSEIRRGGGGLRQRGHDVVVEAAGIHLSRRGQDGLETQLGGDAPRPRVGRFIKAEPGAGFIFEGVQPVREEID